MLAKASELTANRRAPPDTANPVSIMWLANAASRLWKGQAS